MPQAVPVAVRGEIFRLRQARHTYAEIAELTAQKARTVRALCDRFRRLGEAGLQPSYDRCAQRSSRFSATLKEAAFARKREHPRWGAAVIRLELAGEFPEEALPSRRTLQDWFQREGLQPGRSRRPCAERARAKEPHEVWQLDGKEGMRLRDGTAVVALNVVDEASGALLSTAVFPPQEV